MTRTEDKELLELIYRSIQSISAVSFDQLRPKASLNNDLHIYGDDVDEIFEEINKRFPFEWQTFPFGDYFDSEGSRPGQTIEFFLSVLLIPVRIILWWHERIFGSLYGRKLANWLFNLGHLKHPPFTIGQLFAFVKNQTWSKNLEIPDDLDSLDRELADILKKKK